MSIHGVLAIGLTDGAKCREIHLAVRVGVSAVHDERNLGTTNWKPQRSHQHLRGKDDENGGSRPPSVAGLVDVLAVGCSQALDPVEKGLRAISDQIVRDGGRGLPRIY